ncbi:MAG: hypothetical protein AVDCRST_MAG25-2942 [uncultured Rubrobacteraceae bacterium]|uniref:Uncharacterized protein n=1 Tax=uncultured Rubrobacteraceae bacterium TaxID=349277 RepID=A0A6J4S1C9_9ACTN|nr:MAG: hypothetical protein AVDCRST_MAG25-2942 [uncultured Rubrobacteraceae bacterium]
MRREQRLSSTQRSAARIMPSSISQTVSLNIPLDNDKKKGRGVVALAL